MTVPPPGTVGGTLPCGRMFFLNASIPGVPIESRNNYEEKEKKNKADVKF